jgi:hypothetical protein
MAREGGEALSLFADVLMMMMMDVWPSGFNNLIFGVARMSSRSTRWPSNKTLN